MCGGWRERGYERISTGDGSYSLQRASAAGVPDLGAPGSLEAMHNRAGAMSESREIYGRLIGPAFLAVQSPRFLSLGLGLGYNEALIAEQGLLHSQDWFCVSYEADPALVDSFWRFLTDQELDPEIQETYADLFGRLQNPGLAKSALVRARGEGRWVLEGAMNARTEPPFQVHAFLWDAFSQRTSPELWEESFLTQFLGRFASSERAALSTYAGVSKLKRALRANGFEVSLREGFHGKRNSTLAWRGDWPSFT